MAKSLLPVRRYGRTLAERFHDYAMPEPNSGCWLWLGSWDPRKYGQLRVGKKLRAASHVSLELAGTPVPMGMFACHRCDTPPCVNPAHLFIGTQRDNIADSLRKGRMKAPPLAKPGQGRKLRCPRGHDYADAYLVKGKGWQQCRECKRLAKARRRAAFVAQGLRCDGLERAA